MTVGETQGAGEAAFELALEVRDYELDLQGIVNNANYLHYYEHARHAFIRSRGFDFASLHAEGIDPVVYRAEIDYREPLVSGDSFRVEVWARLEGRLKIVFEERVLRAGGREASSARFVVALVKAGRPIPPPPEVLARLGLARP